MSEANQNQGQNASGDAPSCCCATKKCSKGWILLLILLIVAGAGYAVSRGPLFDMIFAGKRIKASEPYKMALAAVQADPAVIEKLGKPIEAEGSPDGNLNDAECQIFFEVKGPNGTAKVAGMARTLSGAWSFTQLDVTFADGSKTAVKTTSDNGGPGEAPAWPG